MVKKILSLEVVSILITILNIFPLIMSARLSPSGSSEVIFLDVGQGDSILIKSKTNQYGLIDTGKNGNILSNLEKYIPANNKTLEFIILTHPDQDHIGMFSEISKRYAIKNLFMNKTAKTNNTLDKIKDIIITKSIPNYPLYDINDFIFGEFNIDVLWPVSNTSSGDFESNEYSIGISLSLDSFDLVSMGDLGSYVEDDLINFLPNKHFEVLKLSHHGSKHSSSEDFIKFVDPEIAIISAGRNNSYGHPSSEVIDRLTENKVPFISTQERGDIRIEIQESGIFDIK